MQQDPPFDSKGIVDFRSVLEECAQLVGHVHTVFLLILDPVHGSGATIAGQAATPVAETVDTLFEMLNQLPQLVVGLTDSHVGSLATCLLAACDLVVVGSNADFELVSGAAAKGLLPLCLLYRLGPAVAEHHLTAGPIMGAHRARELGLVGEIMPSVEAIERRQRDLREISLASSPEAVGFMKRVLRGGSRGEAGSWVSAPRAPTSICQWQSAPSPCDVGEASKAAVSLGARMRDGDDQTPQTLSDRKNFKISGKGKSSKIPSRAEKGVPLLSPSDAVPQFEDNLSDKQAPWKWLESGGRDSFGGVPGHAFQGNPVQPQSAPWPYVGDGRSGFGGGVGHAFQSNPAGMPAGEQKPWQPPQQLTPKRQNLAALYENYRGPITALMICNIPCSISAQTLADAVNSCGLGGKYDFLYLPMKGRPVSNERSVRRSNLGYGFINFPCDADAARFKEVFSGYRFEQTLSLKRVVVKPAHVQGCVGNIRSATPFLPLCDST